MFCVSIARLRLVRIVLLAQPRVRRNPLKMGVDAAFRFHAISEMASGKQADRMLDVF